MTMLTIADIDQHLSRQDRFCLIDWLLAQNLLQYSHYEAWRQGKQDYLDDALHIDRAALTALLSDTQTHCQALGLCEEPQDFQHWGSEHPVRLKASSNADIHRQLTQQWLKPQDVPQLDLFMDNAAVITENRLCDALSGRQFDPAQQQLTDLSKLNPEHPQLGHYQDLINYGRHCQSNSDIDAQQIGAEVAGLQQEVMPLAQDVLGHCARDYIAFAWRRLADNMTGMNYDIDNPQHHRSFALAQIPDWAAVRQNLQNEPTLAQHAPLLEQLALSYSALQQHEKALLIWCFLFEQHTDFAETAIDNHRQQAVNDLWQAFAELDETLSDSLGKALENGLDSAWFSAFMLLKQPGLLHHLHECPALAHPASTAMIAVLQNQLAGNNEIAAREQLKAVHPALLSMLMAVRVR